MSEIDKDKDKETEERKDEITSNENIKDFGIPGYVGIKKNIQFH